MPDPDITVKYPLRDWSSVWRRLQNGVLGSSAKGILYLIIHEKVGTRERGNRLMPGRFPSPLCSTCTETDTISHRYLNCSRVSESWDWLKAKLVTLDSLIS